MALWRSVIFNTGVRELAPPEKGYYSYDLGAWHIIVLNTNCGSQVLGGRGQDSPQEQWLENFQESWKQSVLGAQQSLRSVLSPC